MERTLGKVYTTFIPWALIYYSGERVCFILFYQEIYHGEPPETRY